MCEGLFSLVVAELEGSDFFANSRNFEHHYGTMENFERIHNIQRVFSESDLLSNDELRNLMVDGNTDIVY